MMSQTIELNLTRRWELHDGSYHYIVDSDSAMRAYLLDLTTRTEHIRCARYYGRLPAGVYRLEEVCRR